MIKEKEFRTRIEEMPKKIYSKTKIASYTDFVIEDGVLHFIRVNTRKKWSLNISDLYKIYREYSFINTRVIKTATNRKVNSPSVAVLMAIKCIDEKGNRLQ